MSSTSELSFPSRAEIHHTHRDVTGGWLRPTVFGAMDGLVSNFALITGVAAGSHSDPTAIVLAGIAGLGAGAFSMAAGEYVSVASQAELALAEIEVERREHERSPGAEQDELAGLYQARGLDPAAGRRGGQAAFAQPGRRPRRPRAGGARGQPGRPALAGPRRHVVPAVVRRWRVPAARSLPARRVVAASRGGHLGDRPVLRRRGRVARYREELVVERAAPARVRCRGRRADVRARQPGRRSGESDRAQRGGRCLARPRRCRATRSAA